MIQHAATRHLLPLIVLLFLVHPCLAQSGVVTFEETAFDFGAIEEGIEATHTFEFTNTGDAPVKLVDVRPSCGCTTPRWSREPVAPGATGSVTAVYHSEGRPGPFDKGITIETDGEPQILQLRIRGEVAPVALTGLRLGNLVLGVNEVRFDRIQVGPPAVANVRIQNAGTVALRVDSVLTDAPALFSDYAGRTLQPGRSDDLTLILDTESLKSGQEVKYEFTLVTDDTTLPEKTIQISGRVE
ncbi:MAG TPA: DUF1573 domain-containing protein [Rhodothermales bacterium]